MEVLFRRVDDLEWHVGVEQRRNDSFEHLHIPDDVVRVGVAGYSRWKR
jgi:hypothetical protein